MLNEKAAKLSRNALPLQLENLKKAYPFFKRAIHSHYSLIPEDAIVSTIFF